VPVTVAKRSLSRTMTVFCIIGNIERYTSAEMTVCSTHINDLDAIESPSGSTLLMGELDTLLVALLVRKSLLILVLPVSTERLLGGLVLIIVKMQIGESNEA
jgi:hypothetical protein